MEAKRAEEESARKHKREKAKAKTKQEAAAALEKKPLLVFKGGADIDSDYSARSAK